MTAGQGREPLWRPDGGPTLMAAAAAAAGVADSQALHDWSVSDPDAFWSFAWQQCGVVGERGPGPALERGTELMDDRWFPGSALGYAENLLAGGDRAGAAAEAVVAVREDGAREVITWAELSARVAAFADLLRGVGVGVGDVVAAWVANTPSALVAMLATNSLGAIFTSTSPDFGVAGVVDRFGQVAPTVLVACDGYQYGGKVHDRARLLPEVVAQLPSLVAVVVADEVGAPVPELPLPVLPWPTAVPGAAPTWHRADPSLAGFVLYSSGTTGRPKCIVHSAAGILLKQLTEHQFHCDIRAGDRVFYYTTCGWMMWNWLVTALASGATIVLYDGSPFHPGPTAMWDLAERERVTLFGTSAKFLDSSAKAGVTPRRTHDLSALRTITSTGSPLSDEGFAYVYRDVAEVHLASISGGTDICGCFVIGDPTRPVYAGEIQGPALGAAVDVWDDKGRSLRDRPGERGELVCTTSFPSMPLRFAADPDGARYRAAYFERFPGVWAHGDFASWTAHGGLVIHGRSDATLNAGGVRIGTAEIYRQVEQLPEVAEALAVGQEWDDDTRIVLFVRLAQGRPPAGPVPADSELAAVITARLRSQCSPRHVPARIVVVPDLPRTRSGKLAELAVADVIHGRAVRNTEGLANPEVLAHFADIAHLRQ